MAAIGLVLAACGSPPASVSARQPHGSSASSAAGDGAVGGVPSSSAAAVTTTTGPTGTAGDTAGSGTASSASVAPRSSTTSLATTSTSQATTTTAGAPPLEPSSGTGAYGYVTAGPSCPVERQGQPCPPQPISAEVDARNASGAEVGSDHSDSYGRYALNLAPGRYTLSVVSSSGWPRCPDTPVSVRGGTASRADISCDTGIR